MTVGELLKFIHRFGDHIDPTTPVRINGEQVHDLTFVIQNPMERGPNRAGIIEQRADRARTQVVDIAVNGRAVAELPIREFRDLPAWD